MQVTLPSFPPSRIGQDIEFFAWDKEKQEVLPSWKWWPKQEEAITLGSNTEFPASVRGYRRDWSFDPVKVFRDGLAVELNTSPTTCRAWMWQDAMLGLMVTAPEDVPNFTFTTRPYVEFSDEFRAGFPKDLQILGCNPTFDAYTERQKHVSVNPKKINFRTSGSHLHMSFTTPRGLTYVDTERQVLPQECWAPIVKLADLLIGLPATYVFADELEFKRRKLYGQAGEFRFQEAYGGIEYRVLSSRIFNHPALLSLFTGIWKYLIPEYSRLWLNWDKAWEDELQQAINEGTNMEKFFPVWDHMVQELGRQFEYTLGTTMLTSESAPVWKKLRELNLAGTFPDGGVYSETFDEAHTGWTEYADGWGLGEGFDDYEDSFHDYHDVEET